MTGPAQSPLQAFLALWRTSLLAALAELGIESPVVGTADPTSPAAAAPGETATPISARFVCGGSLQGELLWLAESAVAQRLAHIQSPQLAAAAEFTETHREAFFDFLRKVSSLTVAAWRQSAGAETLISFHSAAEPAFSPQLESEFQISAAQIPEIVLCLQFNADLYGSLTSTDAARTAETNEPPQGHEAVPFVEPEAEHPPARPVRGNLDLLLDVELEATIRFGEREMLLREVMGLMPGAVVELDQMVNEPADLLVAGRLVARGEVVVVDGNFGLRVTEVASASQRAQLVPLSREE